MRTLEVLIPKHHPSSLPDVIYAKYKIFDGIFIKLIKFVNDKYNLSQVIGNCRLPHGIIITLVKIINVSFYFYMSELFNDLWVVNYLFFMMCRLHNLQLRRIYKYKTSGYRKITSPPPSNNDMWSVKQSKNKVCKLYNCLTNTDNVRKLFYTFIYWSVSERHE